MKASTVVIIIVLVAVVGFAIYWFGFRKKEDQSGTKKGQSDLNVDDKNRKVDSELFNEKKKLESLKKEWQMAVAEHNQKDTTESMNKANDLYSKYNAQVKKVKELEKTYK